jgi:metal-sulfur cluster biosynthetic enzyme
MGDGADGGTGVAGERRESVKESNVPTETQIRDALRPVIDPEIGASVVDMGMVRHIKVDDEGKVEVKMVLTAPFCPLAGYITEQARRAVAAVPGVKEARVTVLDEQWNPAWMQR